MIPTYKDISPTSGLDLDESSALDHFYGLDQEAALLMFHQDEGVELYHEDFVHMGEVALNYYLPSVTRYLESLAECEFIEKATDTLDYILIRYSDGDSYPKNMCELIRTLELKRSNIPWHLTTPLPDRVAMALSNYRSAEQDAAPNH